MNSTTIFIPRKIALCFEGIELLEKGFTASPTLTVKKSEKEVFLISLGSYLKVRIKSSNSSLFRSGIYIAAPAKGKVRILVKPIEQ